MVWEGDEIVKTTREMIAAKNPSELAPGTYKCSDSIEAANREIAVAFTPEEMVECAKAIRREKYSSTPKAESLSSAMCIAGIVAIVGAAIAARVI